MNYLAHAYLSFDFDEILTGNFIADTVKGKIDRFPENIQKGIKLHHLIDEFTDSHPVFKQSTARIDSRFGLYSGIIIDMFYDHFLAANWNLYSEVDLRSFASKVYTALMKRYCMYPWRMKRMLPHMFISNWLVYYGDADSFKRFFKGLSYRTRYAHDLADAAGEIHRHYKELNDDFNLFFTDIIKYVKSVYP